MSRDPASDRTLRLRDYHGNDFEAIVALDRECFEPGIAYSESEMSRFLGLATRVALVAERRGQIAGFCIGYRAPASIGHILTLDVRASERRGGIGTTLLEQAASRLAHGGARATVLEVDATNAGAIAFYEALRFRRTETIRDYYGPGRHALEMRRTEAPSRARSSRRPPTLDA